MRIEEVRAHYLHAPLEASFGWSLGSTRSRQAVLVEVRTNEGIVGWGEAGSGTLPYAGARFIVEVLSPLASGIDPFNVGLLQQRVNNRLDRAGWTDGGFVAQAWSGLEMAVWDVKGKALGLPISQLLDGRVREGVQVYATGLYYYGQNDLQARVEEARTYAHDGYSAMKMKIGGLTPTEDIAAVTAIRQALDDDIAIMVDANGGYDRHTAMRVGRRLEELGVTWFEEPVAREDLDGYRALRKGLNMAITGGEHLPGVTAFHRLLKADAVSAVQPNVSNCGGLSACRDIAALARAYGVKVFPHVWGTPVGMAAALHMAATVPALPGVGAPRPFVHEPILEYDNTPHPIRHAMLSDDFRPREGWLAVPTRPGLGVEVDPAVLKEFGQAV